MNQKKWRHSENAANTLVSSAGRESAVSHVLTSARFIPSRRRSTDLATSMLVDTKLTLSDAKTTKSMRTPCKNKRRRSLSIVSIICFYLSFA